MKKTHLIWSIVIWTVIVLTSYGWNSYLVISNNREIAINKSQAFFEQIVVARAWNSFHGGVYVPVDDQNQPNPYLTDSLRDVVTLEGLSLTKINPAYMTRQIAEMNQRDSKLNFHITSLNPIRPENKPDEWEAMALGLFETGTKEVFEHVRNDSASTYRYMAPLYTNNSCMKCHAHQGYQVGDVRGGISISFPSGLYTQLATEEILSLGLAHLLAYILGILGLIFYRTRANRYLSIIEEKNRELTAANTTKDKLFSIIAHDLKSPSNVILGFLELLSSDFDRMDTTEQKNYINRINDAAQSTSKLLGNLLLWSRSQRNSIKLEKSTLNLKALTEESVMPYLAHSRNKKQELTIVIPEDMTVFADGSLLKTVISNLFNNAVKFTGEGGKIEIGAAEHDKHTEIYVRDNGTGIPPDKIHCIFSIEDGLSRLGTNGEKGTGLGLSICKEFVELHHGKIVAENQPGEGTVFRVTLPKQA